jgi:hypothetical protein
VRRAVVAGVLASLVLTGCGAAEKLSPRVAVREAAERTSTQEEGTFRLTLVGSDAGFDALNGTEPLTEEDRKYQELVRNGHLVVSAAAGRFGFDVKAGDVDHIIELRFIDKKLYARADVAAITRLAGGSAEEITAGIDGMAAQEGFGFLRDAVAGKWLVADVSAFGDLAKGYSKLFEGMTGGSSTPTSTGADSAEVSAFKALKDAVGKALTEDVSIKEEKSDDTGDHYVATVGSLRSFYAKVKPALEGAMPALGVPTFGDSLPAPEEVPDRPASLDVWIKSGRVVRLQLPIGQFDPAGAKASDVALRIDIDRSAPSLTAPDGAVPVDIAGIIGAYMRQFSGMLDGISGAGELEYD